MKGWPVVSHCGALSFLVLWALFPLTVLALEEGRFVLDCDGALFSLEARAAPLGEIVKALEDCTGIHIATHTPPERTVYARYEELQLGDLLDRLRVSYVLTYDRRDDGSYVLEDAILFDKKAALLAEDPALRRAIAEHIARLADGEDPSAAGQSRWKLIEIGSAAIPALEQTLLDSDLQARQFALHALTYLREQYNPTMRFYEVLLEGLKDDAFPFSMTADGMAHYKPLENARNGYEYFRTHPEDIVPAETILARGLYSHDPQQRLLSALILGGAGRTQNAGRLIQILIPHLQDNRLSSDGNLAAYALGQLGERVRPHLAPLAEDEDDQASSYVRRILEALDNPGSSAMRRPGLVFEGWIAANFPDENGQYHYPEPPPTPDGPSSVEEPIEYTFLSGDTLENLSKLFLVSLEELMRVNGFTDHRQGAPGDKILIPPPNI